MNKVRGNGDLLQSTDLASIIVHAKTVTHFRLTRKLHVTCKQTTVKAKLRVTLAIGT